MWILGRRRPVRCNAPDSLAGRALRIGGALLIGAGVERLTGCIVTCEQSALIADTQVAVGELMHRHRAAYEVCAVAGLRQLENQVFESNGVVVTHYPLMFARQHQLQFDPGQLGESAFLLRRLDSEAAIEVGDEVLLQIAVGSGVIGDAVMPEFLRQPPLDGAEGALAAAAGLRRTGQDLVDAERAQGLADLAVLLVGHFTGWPALAEMAAAIGIELAETAVVAHHRFQSREG